MSSEVRLDGSDCRDAFDLTDCGRELGVLVEPGFGELRPDADIVDCDDRSGCCSSTGESQCTAVQRWNMSTERKGSGSRAERTQRC